MAAADVAQFLWKKFLRSLVDSESELSGAMNLFSYFEAIKSVLVNTQIIPFSLEMLMPWNASWEMSTYVWANAYLSELNYALAECRIFANEGREINKKILVYSPSTVYFLLKMKRRLTTLKRKFVILVSNAREQKERNNTVKRLVLLTQAKVAVKKNLEEIVVLPNASTLEIHELLVDADRVGFTPIGIVGMAGVGKSTMVQEVLTFHRVSTEFSPIVWLCLSDIIPEKELVDSTSASISIVTCILDKLGEKETSISGLGLDSVLERLNHILSAKRYLIVLDDVWHTMEFYSDIGHNLPEGEKFGDRLSHGLPKDCGGAVIVTSRIREVAQDMVGQNNVFLARPWDKGWCWMHFRSFVTTKAEGFGEEKRFSMSNWEIVQKIENEILDQIGGLPSIAKALAELIVEKRISETDDKGSALKEMLIPHEFLIHRSYIFVPVNERNIKWIADKTDIPKCPVFVFVDLKMEFFAVRLLEEFRYQLNQDQVIAVLDQSFVNRQKIKTEEPEKALKEFYGILENLKCKGHKFADEIQKKMTIMIVGGDVFANWFMGVICDLKLPGSPSIVPIALGIKANIASSFGWEFDADKVPVNKILGMVLNHAKQMKTDSWHILIKVKATAHQQIPYCLHLFHEADMENEDNTTLIYGGFWNYFSLGVDDPRLYGASRFRHTSRTLSIALAKVEVLKHHGDQWEVLSIPSSIRSIVCLNLPSFLGELTPWTTADIKKDQTRGLSSSFIDDGYLEIIGSKDDLLSQKKRWIRLDQVREIRFKFIEDSVEVVNMMIDGVLWKKTPLDGLVEIEISYNCQVNILVKQDYSARSIHDSSQPCGSETADDDDAKGRKKSGGASTSSFLIDDNELEEKSQGHKKIGAASSFKIFEEDDIN
ncbi:uncharacterized protein LOC133725707 isoform X1 [Rosa rugosa]|uniref:uncharacterized protein LOC133725707 isoform X1 n=1 Tax=Rosa rugosa TaxID=74645 RepID=UPI002B40A38B|nr:uncharacterized protein LOC133725707 isoform X1 [Rosa rugosa]